jgi:hypothetical protein
MTPVGPRAPGVEQDNLRSARRFRVLQQAKIVVGAKTMIHCEVRDLSAGGARIAIRQHVKLPESFELFICAQDLRVYPARLRWRNGDFAGVSFGAEEAEELPTVKPQPYQIAAASYPVLVQSNHVLPTDPEPRRLAHHSSAGSRALVLTGDRTQTDGALARASIQAGPYGWERRRRRIRRSAI